MPAEQAARIAAHGTDATQLLHRRADGSGARSTNFGGKAMRAVASLLGGSVTLQLLPAESRLRLEVTAPRAREVAVAEPGALRLWFVDDDPMMRIAGARGCKRPIVVGCCYTC